MKRFRSAVVASLLAIPLPAASPFASEEAKPVTRSVYLMGTRCTLTAWSAFAFDPAVGTLIDAWGLRTGGRIPSGEELERARKNAGMRRFAFDPKACTITRQADAWIDSGAFGKGEALDRALRAQEHDGAIPWMIDLGGQLAVHGRLPGSEPWTAYVPHPERRGDPFLALEFESGSFATSGGSERDSATAGGRVGHILDPRSGRPAAFRGSVTVLHQSALAADILSTALYVMGPEQGLKWANARGLAACFLVPVGDAAEIVASAAFPPAARIAP